MSAEEDNWSSKNYTWIVDKEEGYVAARIISQDGDNFVVELDNNEVSILQIIKIKYILKKINED